MVKKPTTSTTTTKRKRGRPIERYTPAEKKQMSLEEEAKEFFNSRVKAESKSKDPALSLRNFYAGSALSGLLGSGKYNRADELVEEAFRYADLMIRNST
jgi:hypothetical protein